MFNNTCLRHPRHRRGDAGGRDRLPRGDHDAAFAHLRAAVALDDDLPYDEPWGWMQPTRHALGALLLEQGRVAEAEAVYRADLGLGGTLRRAASIPDNVWACTASTMPRAARQAGRRGSSTSSCDIAAARADVPVKASCFCRLAAVA